MVRSALQTSTVLAPAHKAAANETLYKGDVVSTGLEGATKLIFPDNTIIDLGPRSMFKVERFEGSSSESRQAFFTLLYGRMRALVTKTISGNSKLQVRTPDTLMGVRGTEFVVNAPLAFSRGTVGTAAAMATRTEITVLSGLVSMSVPKLGNATIDVPAGTRIATSALAGAMPAPTALAPTQLAEIRVASSVGDNTFDRTVNLDAGAHNENAPLAASPTSVAGEQGSTVRETTSESFDSGDTGGIDGFDALDSMEDVPAMRIPGNLQPVDVNLKR